MAELSDGNILLRPYREEDVDALYEAVRESVREVSLWLPWCSEDYGVEDSRAFVTSRVAASKDEAEYSFAVVDVGTGKFLGGVGLNQMNRIHQCCNLGYWVRTSCAGRGVASGAARLAGRFALEELGLQRVEIYAATENYASQRVAEKAGALREGLVRKRLRIRGQPQDAVLFSFVAEDFEAVGSRQ